MKYFFRLNSLLIFILLTTSLFFFGCTKDPIVNIDPISGKFNIVRAFDTNTGKETEVPEDLSLYFFRDDVIIFGHLYSDISYANRKVKLQSYSIFNNVNIENIDIDINAYDYINIINLTREGESIAEFIELGDVSYLVHQNYLYEINLIERLDKEKFEFAKENRKIYRTKPLYKPLKTTGGFIGLRDDSENESTYYTLYVYSDYNTMNVYFTDRLVIPKSNGYLIANNSKQVVGGAFKNTFKFEFTKDFIAKHENISDYNKYYISEPSVINYASPYMISFMTINKNFLNNTYRERYETYSIEKDGLRNKLNTSDIIGEDWIKTVMDNIYFDYLKDVNYKIIPSNIGIVRRNGYWILKTHLFGGKSIDDVFIRIHPAYLNQDSNSNFITMEQIKELYTSAVDYTISPERSLALVNTGSNIKVVSLYSSYFNIKDSFSMVNNDFNLIMDHWIVGSEAEDQLFNIKQSNGWWRIY